MISIASTALWRAASPLRSPVLARTAAAAAAVYVCVCVYIYIYIYI